MAFAGAGTVADRDQPGHGPAMTGKNDVLAVFSPAHQIGQPSFGVTDGNIHMPFEPILWSKCKNDANSLPTNSPTRDN